MTKGRILVVDDDPSLRRVLQAQLEQQGYEVAVAASAQQTLSLLELRAFDLVITDLKMPGMSGLELLKHARSKYPQAIVIMLTAFGTVDTAVEAMKAGAYDYLTKPVHPDEMSVVVRRALAFENILGHSDALLEVLDMAPEPRAAIPLFSSAGRQAQGRSYWREPSTSIVPAATTRWSPSTAVRSQRTCLNPNSSDTGGERLREQSLTRKGGSNWPTAVPSFSTKSPKCRPISKSSYSD
jgi:CheY-like chemotaxis protein